MERQRPRGGEQSASEGVLVTPAAFESALRGVAFNTWDDFAFAALSGGGRPEEPAEAGSVIRLDPLRIFTWVAVLLVNGAVWLVAALLQGAGGLLVTAGYGVGLYLLLARWVEPDPTLSHVAALLWPLLPMVLAAFGAQVVGLISPSSARTGAFLYLGLSLLPQLALAVVLLAAGPTDARPRLHRHRAPLVAVIFLGVYVAIITATVACTDDAEAERLWNVSVGTLPWVGGAAVLVAGKLHLSPDLLVPPEVITWLLDMGCLALFLAGHLRLGVPITSNGLSWVTYVAMLLALVLLAAFFIRSFPFLLAAVGTMIIAARISSEAGKMVSSYGSDELSMFVGVTVLGFLGLVVLISVLQVHQRKAELESSVRSFLRRHLQVNTAGRGFSDGLAGTVAAGAADDHAEVE